MTDKIKKKKPVNLSPRKGSDKKAAKKAVKKVFSKKRPPKTAPSTARKATRRAGFSAPSVRPRPARKKSAVPAARPSPAMRVLWATGMLGGVMVVTSALWSVWHAPASDSAALPANPFASPMASPVDRSPAASEPPKPVGVPAAIALPPSPAPAAVAPTAVIVDPTAETPLQIFQAAPRSSETLPATSSLTPSTDTPPPAPSVALVAAFNEASRISADHRVAWWSQWLSQPSHVHTELGSLGPDPVIRDIVPLVPANFNCTTFVETVAALTRSSDPPSFFRRLIEIRYYQGKADYLSRNHFPEADWIPHNIAAGTITDITAQVAKAGNVSLGVEQKTLDRPAWLARQEARSTRVARAVSFARAAGPIDPQWSQTQTVRLSFIPRAGLRQVIDHIPDGALINFVRKNEPKRPVLITHQGIVVRESGEVFLRHAAPGSPVRTVVLRDYFRRNASFVGFTLDKVSDPVAGING